MPDCSCAAWRGRALWLRNLNKSWKGKFPQLFHNRKGFNRLPVGLGCCDQEPVAIRGVQKRQVTGGQQRRKTRFNEIVAIPVAPKRNHKIKGPHDTHVLRIPCQSSAARCSPEAVKCPSGVRSVTVSTSGPALMPGYSASRRCASRIEWFSPSGVLVHCAT